MLQLYVLDTTIVLYVYNEYMWSVYKYIHIYIIHWKRVGDYSLLLVNLLIERK